MRRFFLVVAVSGASFTGAGLAVGGVVDATTVPGTAGAGTSAPGPADTSAGTSADTTGGTTAETTVGTAASAVTITVTELATIPDIALQDPFTDGTDIAGLSRGDDFNVIMLRYDLSGKGTGFGGFPGGFQPNRLLRHSTGVWLIGSSDGFSCGVASVDPATLQVAPPIVVSEKGSCNSQVVDTESPNRVWFSVFDFGNDGSSRFSVSNIDLGTGVVSAPVPIDGTFTQGDGVGYGQLESAGGYAFWMFYAPSDDAGNPLNGPDGQPLKNVLVRVDPSGAVTTTATADSYVATAGTLYRMTADGNGRFEVDPATMTETKSDEFPRRPADITVDGWGLFSGIGPGPTGEIGLTVVASNASGDRVRADVDLGDDASDNFPRNWLIEVGDRVILVVSSTDYADDTTTRQTKFFEVTIG